MIKEIPIGSIWGDDPFVSDRDFCQKVISVNSTCVEYESGSGDRTCLPSERFLQMFPYRHRDLEINDEQLDDMLHALGQSHTPQRSEMGWRNYYVVDQPHDGWADLVSKGLAEACYAGVPGSRYIYRVSEQGLKLLGVTLK